MWFRMHIRRFASRQLVGPQALDLLLSAPLLPTWACPGPQVEGWLRHQALPPQQNDFHQNIYTIAGKALPPPHQTLSGYRAPKYRVYIKIIGGWPGFYDYQRLI